jgi:steroid delta-isomerase-like uncharacterized protein
MIQPMETAKQWLEGMNRYDLDQMKALCWEEAVSDEVAEPEPFKGRDKIAQSYRELFAAFPDACAKILNIFAGQNQVLAEVRWSGTNKGAFRGTPATGKFVDIRIAYIFRIEGGKIRTITEYYDGATVASQMGLG